MAGVVNRCNVCKKDSSLVVYLPTGSPVNFCKSCYKVFVEAQKGLLATMAGEHIPADNYRVVSHDPENEDLQCRADFLEL